MKKIISPLVLGVLILSGFGALALPNYGANTAFNNDDNEIHITIPRITYEIRQRGEMQEIFAEDFGRLSNPGEPRLPSKIFTIAIPSGSKFMELTYTTGESVALSGSYNIPPISPSYRLSNNSPVDIGKNVDAYEENYELIYSSDDFYPPHIAEFVRTAGYREYNLVDVQVTPFTYRPLSGKLMFHPDITLSIKYKIPDKTPKAITKSSVITTQIAQEIILNYHQSKEWYQINNIMHEGLHDFVIITLDSLTGAIAPLVTWETEKGRTVEVVTTSWIDTHYNGYDLAEKMRNFLRDKYPMEEWGIQDVLIVGHRDDIPMRRTWQQINPGDSKPETDFYYAELSKPDSESWDTDGDHQYGEDADAIDFYSEVNVGRIPWSDSETVLHICEKSVAYEQNNDPSFKNNILLLAAFVDRDTDGATFMEYCVDASLHPWMSSWMKTRMYEPRSTYAADYPLTHENVLSVWSRGKYAFVSWHAHGNPYGSGYFISVDDCPSLNDDYPAIISAASCSNSDTDYLNIGQAMMKQGAVGFLGANKAVFYRSGWDDPNDGSDQSFKYFFTTAVTSGAYTQGQAHQYALREMYSRGLWDRLKYETFVHGSFWGNPDLGIALTSQSTPPEIPSRPEGPVSGEVQTEYTFKSSTNDPDGDFVYYLFNWGDGTNSGWLGPYASGEQCSATHIWDEQGNYEIRVKAKDSNGAESDWSVPLSISMPKIYEKPLCELINTILELIRCLFLYMG